MDITQILSLLKDGGPWSLAALGWYLYFRRDQRVTALEDWRAQMLEKTIALAQRTSDINHLALGIATSRGQGAEESTHE